MNLNQKKTCKIFSNNNIATSQETTLHLLSKQLSPLRINILNSTILDNQPFLFVSELVSSISMLSISNCRSDVVLSLSTDDALPGLCFQHSHLFKSSSYCFVPLLTIPMGFFFSLLPLFISLSLQSTGQIRQN